MSNSSNPENIIQTVIRLVESDESSIIRLNANGGNSILIVCEPIREAEYIKSIQSLMSNEKYEIIDLESILCEFVKVSESSLSDRFELLKGSVHQIFKAPEGEDGPDLFGLIIDVIDSSFNKGLIPVLINSGCLYGSGIDNIHIMENEKIMKSKIPLLILYPATREPDKLLFLGNRPSSKYRCMIID